MSKDKSSKVSLAEFDINELTEGFDEGQVGDLPTFEPFPDGTYKGLDFDAAIQETGSAKTKDLWKRLELSFVLAENTEVTLANEDDNLPADGSNSQFSYTLMQFDETSGKVIPTVAPHSATKNDGTTYEAYGSYASMNKDLILSSGGAIEAKDIKTLLAVLAATKTVDVTFGHRLGKANDEGIKPVYQTIKEIVFHED